MSKNQQTRESFWKQEEQFEPLGQLKEEEKDT